MIVVYREYGTRFVEAAEYLKSTNQEYIFRNARCFTHQESIATGIYAESQKIIDHYATFNIPLIDIPDAN